MNFNSNHGVGLLGAELVTVTPFFTLDYTIEYSQHSPELCENHTGPIFNYSDPTFVGAFGSALVTVKGLGSDDFTLSGMIAKDSYVNISTCISPFLTLLLLVA